MISISPYYSEGGHTIYHGDCREILSWLPMVDLVATDPPYGIAYATNYGGAWYQRPIAHDTTLQVVAAAWPLIMARLREDRHWYAFASPRRLPQAIEAFGGEYRQVLAWDKGDQGTAGDLECGFGEAWEAIIYGMKGRRPLNGRRPRTIIRCDWSGNNDPVHPTVKPAALMGKLINWSSLPGEVVLDPFMGSGTTLIAAKLAGRRSIGIELEERFCEVAANRLRQGVLF